MVSAMFVKSSVPQWYPIAKRFVLRGYDRVRMQTQSTSQNPSYVWFKTMAAVMAMGMFTAASNEKSLGYPQLFCICEGEPSEKQNVSKENGEVTAVDIVKSVASALQSSLDPKDILGVSPVLKQWMQSIMETTQNLSQNDIDFQPVMQELFRLLSLASNLQADGLSASEVVSRFLEAIVQHRYHDRKSLTCKEEDADDIMVFSNEDTTSIQDIFHFVNTHHNEIHSIFRKYLSAIDYNRITPIALLYYLEYRSELSKSDDLFFCLCANIAKCNMRLEEWPKIDILQWNSMMNTENDTSRLHILVHDALALSQLSYARTIDEIRTGLIAFDSTLYEYELLDCDLKSEPGRPAHFSAIRKNKSSAGLPFGSNDCAEMDVVLVIRGTQSVADAITGLLCDSKPYRDGFAHSTILESGRYIANKYRPLFLNVFSATTPNAAARRRINVHIYGHSLGAGTGAIVAMELNASTKANPHEPMIHATAVGYGCPAILSANLIDATQDYITTVVNDSDLVPRLSGISLTNLLYDIIEFNWLPYAQRDMQYFLKEIQRRQPHLFTNDVIDIIYKNIEPKIALAFQDTYLEHGTIPRRTVELYPPGSCIHLYRKGSDDNVISYSYVPNSFYSRIPVNRHMISGTYIC